MGEGAFVDRQVAPGAGGADVQVLEEPLEAGLPIHLPRRPQEALHQIAVRLQKLPEDDGVEFQPLGLAHMEDPAGVEERAQPLGLRIVQGQHGAARPEAPDGIQDLLLGARDLDRHRPLDGGLLGLILFRAAEHLPAEQEQRIGELHQRADAAQIAPQAHHLGGRAQVGCLGGQTPDLGPAEAAGIDDLLRVAGEQHSVESPAGATGRGRRPPPAR